MSQAQCDGTLRPRDSLLHVREGSVGVISLRQISGSVMTMAKEVLPAHLARAGDNNKSLMGGFGTFGPRVSFNRCSGEMETRVGTIRIDVVASCVFAHGDCVLRNDGR